MIDTIARRDQNDSNCCCYDTRLRTKTLIRHVKRHEQHDYKTKLQALVYILPAATAITGYAIVIIDRFYIALFSVLEQTHCARM